MITFVIPRDRPSVIFVQVILLLNTTIHSYLHLQLQYINDYDPREEKI